MIRLKQIHVRKERLKTDLYFCFIFEDQSKITNVISMKVQWGLAK
jgi:hypothetical protein